ncbi:coiled-coil-helix-coiled-coil-helix domain-containing protein 1 [Coccinella septempunctata]|uniref:coiled-coil-helix-coiled-coil-helix domain-containing protein 1 n=1 Tax=Coccinella septempunctata TaxID=41139 RepID=UPI001D05D9C3|nr:coiled-coil-helix-coiled-coil-helix domain-containing protein 1 [Coccinella septempunctata]
MRLLSCLLAARTPQREPVPFQEILPLKLKPRVSGKGDRTSEVYCLYEMSVLMACFKANEFNQKVCSKEIENFQQCYDKSVKLKQGRKEKEAKGILIPGEKRLSPKQVNTLLRKFPQF